MLGQIRKVFAAVLLPTGRIPRWQYALLTLIGQAMWLPAFGGDLSLMKDWFLARPAAGAKILASVPGSKLALGFVGTYLTWVAFTNRLVDSGRTRLWAVLPILGVAVTPVFAHFLFGHAASLKSVVEPGDISLIAWAMIVAVVLLIVVSLATIWLTVECIFYESYDPRGLRRRGNDWFARVGRNYILPAGRITRWQFLLVTAVTLALWWPFVSRLFGLSRHGGMPGVELTGFLAGHYFYAIALINRLHDYGKTGWTIVWIYLPLFILVLSGGPPKDPTASHFTSNLAVGLSAIIALAWFYYGATIRGDDDVNRYGPPPGVEA